MRICGIVCEYNPFHNGHAHHLRETRNRSQADFVACVMSGHFMQRGSPALLDKWTRAQMALLAGADVVLELPTLFAVRPAEQFALGGVAMLHALGADALAFGCEVDQLDALRTVACLLQDEPQEFHTALREQLMLGAAHAQARGHALSAILPAGLDAAALSQPNCTLALCYLRALQALGSAMEPLLIPRLGSGYHDSALHAMASATAIREGVRTAQWPDVRAAMPEDAYGLLSAAQESGRLHTPDALDVALLARLRTLPTHYIAALCDVSEGLEHRIVRAAWQAGTREALLDQIKCKRYTRARLSRILCAALLGITQDLAERCPTPPYARLLGFRKSATPLLRHWQRAGNLPLITKLPPSRTLDDPCLALDVHATDLWSLGCAQPTARAAGLDYSTSPVILA